MSKTKGVAKLVVNTDTNPTPQEPSLVENETNGIFVHSTNSSIASKLWFSQGTSLSASFSKVEFDTDFGFKIHTENPINVLHDASIRFGTRGTERWKIDGLNGSSGDLLPSANNSYNIGRTGFNVSNVFSRQLISDDNLALAAFSATKWNIDTSGHFVPTATTQNIGTSALYLSTIYGNQIFSGLGQPLWLGSNGGGYKWYIASGVNAALIPNTAGAFDIGTSSNRVNALYSASLNITTPLAVSMGGTGAATASLARTNLGATTVGSNLFTLANPSAITFLQLNADNTVSTLSDADFRVAIGVEESGGTGFITDSIRTKTTTSAFSIRTGTGYPSRFTIDSSGNVGIGTSSPSGILHLNKASGATDIYLSVAGTTTGIIYSSSSDTTVGSVSAAPLVFLTANTERMRITSTGLVGIGTTNPFAQLQASNIQIGNSATATNNWHLAGEGGDGKLHLYNGNYGSGTSRISITSAGNVGIGTTSPGEKLQVNGALRLDAVSAPTWDTGTRLWMEGGFGSRYDGYQHRFDVGNTRTEAMRIDINGNVGIGLNNPLFPLSVRARSDSGISIESRGRSSDHYSGILFTDSTGSQVGRLAMTTLSASLEKTGNNPIAFQTNGANRLYIGGDGNIGIGNTDPAYLLDCRSVSRIGTNLIGEGAFEINAFGTGDRNAFIDFHAANSPGDNNFRIIREPGVDGNAVFANKGLGRFAFILEAETNPKTLEFNARASGPSGIEIAHNVGGATNNDTLLIKRTSQSTTTGGLRLYNANAITSGTFTYADIDMKGNGNMWIEVGDNSGLDPTGIEFRQNGYIGLYNNIGGVFLSNSTAAFAPTIAGQNLGGNTSRWGTVYYTTLNPPSDVRLKKEIKDIETAKHIVQSVKPKEFTWKNNDKKTAGFIAQEFINVLPIGVSAGSDDSVSLEDPNFESWSIDPFIMVPYLTRALQEAFEEIEKLKQELIELKTNK